MTLFADQQYLGAFGIGAEVTIPGKPDKYVVLQARSWPDFGDNHIEVNLL